MSDGVFVIVCWLAGWVVGVAIALVVVPLLGLGEAGSFLVGMLVGGLGGPAGALVAMRFDIPRSRSYQLIKYAEVAVGLAEVAQVPVEAITDALPERFAREVDDDVMAEVSTGVDSLPEDATEAERVEAATSPAVEAARLRREREAADAEAAAFARGQAQAAEPEQEPAPVPAPNTPDAERPTARLGSTGGPAAPGATPGPDDATAAASEPPADEPERVALPAPAVTIEYSARLTVFDLLDTLPDAAAHTTDVDLIGMVDDLADWCHRFFAARKERFA